MKNNLERTIIRCSIRVFDCAHSKPIFTEDYNLCEHYCSLSETNCEHAYMTMKDERKEKLNKINNEEIN